MRIGRLPQGIIIVMFDLFSVVWVWYLYRGVLSHPNATKYYTYSNDKQPINNLLYHGKHGTHNNTILLMAFNK